MALLMAARLDGIKLRLSRPPTMGPPSVAVDVIWAKSFAPVMRNTPRTLPTLSTTAIVACRFRASASATACAITRSTSTTCKAQRLPQVLAVEAAAAGGLTAACSAATLPLPPPPQAVGKASTAKANIIAVSCRILRVPLRLLHRIIRRTSSRTAQAASHHTGVDRRSD